MMQSEAGNEAGVTEVSEEFVFTEESLTRSFFKEIAPLTKRHHLEVSDDLEVPDPDIDQYIHADQAGFFRLYTVRRNGALIGYATFIINSNLHVKGQLQALSDAIYIVPEHRGGNGHFIEWCIGNLKDEGIERVYVYAPIKNNIGPLLERRGFKHLENIYVRNL